MNFIVELVRSMFSYIFYLAIAAAGVFAGIMFRKMKNKKDSENE